MSQLITVSLPDEMKNALDNFTQQEGVSLDDVVSQAISQHLFLKQSRLLREKMSAKAAAQGIVTDKDVFDRVS